MTTIHWFTAKFACHGDDKQSDGCRSANVSDCAETAIPTCEVNIMMKKHTEEWITQDDGGKIEEMTEILRMRRRVALCMTICNDIITIH